VASALINSTQQVGGSIGTALLNTIATTVTATYLHVHGSSPASVTAGTVHGFAVAFLFAAAILAVALVVVLVFIDAPIGAGTEPVLVGEGARLGGYTGNGSGSDGEQPSPAYLPA
jgi:hypothetical protein